MKSTGLGLRFCDSASSRGAKIYKYSIPQVKEILYENKPLIEGCPSRASAAEFVLRGLRRRVNKTTELLNDLGKEIFAQYGAKK